MIDLNQRLFQNILPKRESIKGDDFCASRAVRANRRHVTELFGHRYWGVKILKVHLLRVRFGFAFELIFPL